VHARVFNTAGQEEYIALRDQWIRDGKGFILVYSISSQASFARIEKFHCQIQRVKESSQSGPAPGPAPVMLVGNKYDRVTEREVSTQEGSALAKELGCDFVEASTKNGVNVEMAFYDVVRQLRRQKQQINSHLEGKGHISAQPKDTNHTRFKEPDDCVLPKKGGCGCVFL
jgi:GTPase KRas protein